MIIYCELCEEVWKMPFIFYAMILLLCSALLLAFALQHAWSARYGKRAFALPLLGGCALLIVLSGCVGRATTNPAAITPMTLSPGAGFFFAGTASNEIYTLFLRDARP